MHAVLCFALSLPADLLSFSFKFWLASLENIFEHHTSVFPRHVTLARDEFVEPAVTRWHCCYIFCSCL